MTMHDEGSDCVCEIFEECSFFDRNEGLNNTILTVQRIFCSGECKENCARYGVYQVLGPEHVPSDLLPFDHLTADHLIAGKTKVPA
ncbi:hypothetical protein P4B35_19875 [Pontiellaceae bacterium B12227]|nr:hypothetical protein [Pontiellaceae bacterium B12227]